jgi:hypothetical protein
VRDEGWRYPSSFKPASGLPELMVTSTDMEN